MLVAVATFPFVHGSGAAGDPLTAPLVAAVEARDLRGSRVPAPDYCLSAQRAIRFYRSKTNAIRSRFSSTVPDRISWPTCHLARRAAREWRARARSAQRRYEHHFSWWRWLPANWQALGACETGYGKRPGNFAHANGSFVSAFGISRREYDADAAYFGAPPWDDARPPTPRQQYLAARGHLARFGDGWTCPGP